MEGAAVAVVLAALCTSFAFGAAAQLATADHWHSFDNIWHGVVHGSDSRDASFFGRTDSPFVDAHSYDGGSCRKYFV
jgi:Spy/CpxP family protein refolding chaperone